MEEKHNSHTVLVVKNEEGDQLEEVEICEDNIKVGIQKVGWEGVDNSSGVA